MSTTNALDDFGIYRKSKGGDDALAGLTTNDMTGDGGLFAKGELSAGKETVKDAAAHLAMLGGWDYQSSGPKFRKELEGAARWVLLEMGGDLGEYDRYYRALDKERAVDSFLRKSLEMCQSPYGLARKMMAMWNKEQAAKQKQRTPDNWLEKSGWAEYAPGD